MFYRRGSRRNRHEYVWARFIYTTSTQRLSGARART